MLPQLPHDPIAHFLILCLRGRFDIHALDEARDWQTRYELKWKAVHHRSIQEGLAPILYSLLRKQRWPPAEILTQWHRSYIRTGVANALLLAELAHIENALEEADIPFIALKGAALLTNIYHNIALRMMADVDLLVHRKDVLPATKIIQALGYAPRHQEEHSGIFLAYENEIALQRLEGIRPMIVELHWSLIDSPYYQDRLPMTWFWETAHPECVGKLTIPTLGPEALLIHLAAHLMFHHQGKGLRWLHDLAEVIFRFSASLDWDIVLKMANRFQLVLPLQQIIPFVAEHWHVSIPSATLEALAHLQASPDEQRIFRRLTSREASSPLRFLDDLATISGRRRKIRFLREKLFPSSHYMRQRYDITRSWSTAFYYPYRWWSGLYNLFTGSKNK